MIINLKKDTDVEYFRKEWLKALKPVEACPGCGPIVIGQQIEDPTILCHIQPWQTVSDHIDGFKKRDDLDVIMPPLHKIVAECVEGGWKGCKSYHVLLKGPGEAV
jgi:hypothetical protein